MRAIAVVAGVWLVVAAIVGTAAGQWIRRQAADLIDPNKRADVQ